MIQIKLAALDEGIEREIPIIEGETLRQGAERAVNKIPAGTFQTEQLFQVLVNGHKIDSGLWDSVKLKETDVVLIAPQMRGSGDDGVGFLREALVIAISIVATVYLGPAVGGGIYGALAVAGATIAGGLLINSLIPLPNPDSSSLSDGISQADSQMYSIESQSNTVRKFQTVMKCYGTNKVFPSVAANPYTEIETDPSTGELVQYLHAIYDFGFGPLNIDTICIGDSPIGQYSDVFYSLVDFQKPDVSEGSWDDATVKALTYYKYDVSTDGISVALDDNQVDGGVEDGYKLIRTAPENFDLVEQTMTLTFACPQGLYSFDARGNKGYGIINLEIYFSKVNEDDWKPYNDPAFVKDFLAVGGNEVLQNRPLKLYPNTPGGNTFGEYPLLQAGISAWTNPDVVTIINGFGIKTVGFGATNIYGLPKGATHLVADNRVTGFSDLVVGTSIIIGGKTIGKVTSISVFSHDSNYSVVTFDTPLENSLALFQWSEGYYYETSSGTSVLTNYLSLIGSGPEIDYVKHLDGKFQINRTDTTQIFATCRFTPKMAGTYKVRIVRTDSAFQYSSTKSGNMAVVSLSSRFAKPPIITTMRHLFLEVKIRATNQLNGAIQNLSAIATSVLPVYDSGTSTWSLQPTRNPAWVFADLLTGEVNKRPLAKSRLHLDSLLEWAEFADQIPTPPTGQTYHFPRFGMNFILDFQTTLQQLMNQVTSACQASPNIIDGKYGVLIDKLKTVPVQVFTPRNSRDFSSSRTYTVQPDGLQVQFVDPGSGWQQTEFSVYDDGFNASNAAKFDSVQTFGCTNNEQAWRFGRYMMAQNRLRQETMSITVDFENLVCTRGDYVQLCQDVMRVGGSPARVKSIVGNRIVIDNGLDTVSGSYGFVFRGSDGLIHQNTLTVINAETFDLDGADLPAPGDLIVIGLVDNIVMDCLIKSITPADELSATIVLVEKADGIYSAESTDVLPAYDPKISRTSDPTKQPPSEVQDLAVADNLWQCAGNGYEYYVDLVWNPPTGSTYEKFEIYVNSGKGFDLAGSTRGTTFHYVVDQSRLDLLHTFKVLALSASGTKMDLGSVAGVTATPATKSTKPTDVTNLSTNITDQVLQLNWNQIPDCDCKSYQIRYSPNLNANWSSSVPLLNVAANVSSASTQARTGVYLIKAIDFLGNESQNSAEAITTIPNLFGLNVIADTTDFPDLLGPVDRVVKFSGALILQDKVIGGLDTGEYYSEGYYYYKDLLDLGDIYTVRLQSLIQAEGFSAADLLSNWDTLSSVEELSSSSVSQWNVEAQYRSTNAFNVMSEWTSLGDIDPISEGVEENFTEWRTFIQGDATGRIFQFRLHLVSNQSSVTPRVFDGKIRADMPDRFESWENLSADATAGYALAYSPSFKGPNSSPNVQVSIDGAQAGDYWTFDYKTLDGFLIRFFDKNGVQVARQFDVAVKGFGRKYTSVI